MIIWTLVLACLFVGVEVGVIFLYNWAQKQAPDQALWVVMGAKVVKILLAVIALVAGYYLGLPLAYMAGGLIAIYLISLIFETVFFVKKKK
ncbi:MAG: hypothetical protein Q4B58_04835 [Bacteroidales bacterium]|nr:hypothetical protein [Bacteroidales bacterium]